MEPRVRSKRGSSALEISIRQNGKPLRKKNKIFEVDMLLKLVIGTTSTYTQLILVFLRAYKCGHEVNRVITSIIHVPIVSNADYTNFHAKET